MIKLWFVLVVEKIHFLMAKCIQELQRYGRVPFEAHYVVMDTRI